MGHVVPPDEPEIGICPDCCEILPCDLRASIKVPDLPLFTGVLVPDPENPCRFTGTVCWNAHCTPFILEFCVDDTADTGMTSLGAIHAQCGACLVEDNHCNPCPEATSPGDCIFKVWP